MPQVSYNNVYSTFLAAPFLRFVVSLLLFLVVFDLFDTMAATADSLSELLSPDAI